MNNINGTNRVSHAFRNLLDYVLKVLAGASFLAMVILTCWQVFTRYLLRNPSSWSEELVSYLFAWMSLLGASIVVGERGHMNIPIVVDHMKPNSQKVLAVFSEVVACLFSAVILVFGGIQITKLAMGQMTSSLSVPVGIFYVVLPLSGVLNIIYTILNIMDILNGSICLTPINERAKNTIKEAKNLKEQETKEQEGKEQETIEAKVKGQEAERTIKTEKHRTEGK